VSLLKYGKDIDLSKLTWLNTGEKEI